MRDSRGPQASSKFLARTLTVGELPPRVDVRPLSGGPAQGWPAGGVIFTRTKIIKGTLAGQQRGRLATGSDAQSLRTVVSPGYFFLAAAVSFSAGAAFAAGALAACCGFTVCTPRPNRRQYGPAGANSSSNCTCSG